MSAAPALQQTPETTESSQNEALRESGEFLIEKTFTEKGVEGLESLAEEDVVSNVKRMEALTETSVDVPESANELATQLQAAKKQAESDLLAAKKKLFFALGKGTDYEQAKAELEPMKAAVVEATEALEGAKEEQTPQDTSLREAPIETVNPSAEGEEPTAEPVEESVSAEPEAPAQEADATKKAEVQEEVSPKEEASESAAPEAVNEKGEADWGALIVEEQHKKESAENDYTEAQKILTDFQQERAGTLTPIEQKYVAVLQTQLEMDRLTAALAGSQMALYAINKNIEKLKATDPENPAVAILTEEQTEKTNFSQNLTAQLETAATQHHEIREDYDIAMEAFDESVSEEGDTEDTEDLTGGSFGGSNFERPLALTPEDEASFEARAAGVEVGKHVQKETKDKEGSRAKGLWSFMKRKGGQMAHPRMKLSTAGGAGVKKKRGFFKWLFGIK